MSRIFGFGEEVPGYSVRVVNEREARAAAGILFFVSIIAFLNAFESGDFTMTRIVVLAFGIDFFIRVFVNPRFSPSLILGRIMVSKQQPEYSGAPQKRFAWGLGLAIAVVMMVWSFGLNYAGPVALLGCVACILLLFFESAFGICIGCAIYNAIFPGKAQLCPGGSCEITERAPITKVGFGQIGAVVATAAVLFAAAPTIAALDQPVTPARTLSGTTTVASDCVVPDFAKFLGHEEKWKIQNGCA